MEHVELLRVHTSGTELVLRTPSGQEYLLPLDEALKRAVRMPAPRSTATPEAETETPLSPRQIQAKIRGGQTAAEVAAESGTDLNHILRYEGPVLAERDYVARQAQEIEVSSPLGHEGYRAAFGDEPASLGDMVYTRLRAFGVDPDTLSWDAWKMDAGTWRIVARFEVPESLPDLGEEPPAKWTFHPGRRHLQNANRWGQVLSEWEPWDMLPSQRKLVPVGSGRPFDVEDSEQSSDPDDAATPPSAASSAEPGPQEGLLDVLSRRRGTRTGEDAEQDEELARLLARTRDDSGSDDEDTREEAHRETRADGRQEPETPDADWPPLRRVPDPIPATAESDEAARAPKKRRSQVPSWDEIVFGRSAKGDDEDQ